MTGKYEDWTSRLKFKHFFFLKCEFPLNYKVGSPSALGLSSTPAKRLYRVSFDYCYQTVVYLHLRRYSFMLDGNTKVTVVHKQK